MGKLTQTEFQNQLNHKFNVTFSEEDQYEVELIELKEGSLVESLNVVPFSLLFRAARKENIYNQGIYSLKSQEDEQYDFFMIPRQPDNDHIYYEVIIN